MAKYFVERFVTKLDVMEVEAKDEEEAYEFAVENYVGKWQQQGIDRELYVVDGVIMFDSLD